MNPCGKGRSYFFGFVCGSWQRRQRMRWLLSGAPHFEQRRFFFFSTNLVRGRVFMEDSLGFSMIRRITGKTENTAAVAGTHKSSQFFPQTQEASD